MIFKNHNDFKECVIWWDEDDSKIDADLIFYIHDYIKRGTYNMKFYTLIYDLNCNLNEIKSLFSLNRRNYLNNALKNDFISYANLNDTKWTIDFIIDAFNSFARFKKIKEVKIDEIKDLFNEKMICTIVMYKEKIISAYIYYHDGKIIRQFLKIPFENNLGNKEISMISTLHIFRDVELFKSMGFEKYDWGGLYQEGQDQTKVKGIINFKRSFGGIETQIWKSVQPLTQKGEIAYKKYFEKR